MGLRTTDGALPFPMIVCMPRGCADNHTVPDAVTVASLAAGRPHEGPFSTAQTTRRIQHQGMVLHGSEVPETPLLTSHCTTRRRGPTGARHCRGTAAKAWSKVFVSLPMITVSIPVRTGVGKIPVAGMEAQMPVSLDCSSP